MAELMKELLRASEQGIPPATGQELRRFVEAFNRAPRSVTGILRQPTSRVRSVTTDAYPGTNGDTLQVLWARDCPTQDSVNMF